MSRKSRRLRDALITPSIVIGCVVVGCAAVDFTFVIWPIAVGVVFLCGIAAAHTLKQADSSIYGEEVHVSTAQRMQIDDCERLAQDLFCLYSKYVVAASDRLGDKRDPFDALTSLLERSTACFDPGWSDVCLTIVQAFGTMRDVRALPVLARVRLARGSEFRDAVDSAIALIADRPRLSSPVASITDARQGVLLTQDSPELSAAAAYLPLWINSDSSFGEREYRTASAN